MIEAMYLALGIGAWTRGVVLARQARLSGSHPGSNRPGLHRAPTHRAWLLLALVAIAMGSVRALESHLFIAHAARHLADAFEVYHLRRAVQAPAVALTAGTTGAMVSLILIQTRAGAMGIAWAMILASLGVAGARSVSHHDLDHALDTGPLGLGAGAWIEGLLIVGALVATGVARYRPGGMLHVPIAAARHDATLDRAVRSRWRLTLIASLGVGIVAGGGGYAATGGGPGPRAILDALTAPHDAEPQPEPEQEPETGPSRDRRSAPALAGGTGSESGARSTADSQQPARGAGPEDPPVITFDDPRYLWWEAEHADSETFGDPPAFRPNTPRERSVLSGGDWLQTDRGSEAHATWTIDVPEPGTYTFWTRKFWKHGPFRYRWNQGPWTEVGTDIALADSVELRTHVVANWVRLGRVTLDEGPNRLRIEGLAEARAMAFDCWLLAAEPFVPRGKLRPGERAGVDEPGWFAWEPWTDPDSEPLLDLSWLNQDRAGVDGFVVREGERLVFENTGEPVRFWGVNADAATDDREAIRRLAKDLASMGVNAVRVHRFIADRAEGDPGAIDEAYLDQLHFFVDAMASKGIYTALSFYYPMWLHVRERDGLAGYDEGDVPLGLLYYDDRMQTLWRSWARELLTRPNPYSGVPLARDPAVAIVEIVNEDSLLFWTFDPAKGRIPAEAIAPLERAFAEFASERYGSIHAALDAWEHASVPGSPDRPERERLGLYAAGFLTSNEWAINQRHPVRARDQLEFLARVQRGFYADAARYLREELGVRCAIQASNWKTADESTLGLIERWTYEPAGVIGRNAYFSGEHEGEGAGHSVRAGHTYTDRTGLRGPHAPASIALEVSHAGHPHVVTEYGHPMPNAYRAEGPFLAAALGSHHGTDAIFHFAIGTALWDRSHRKFSVATPVTIGQFPALALTYRRGDLRTAPVAHRESVSLEDLFSFRGTTYWQSPNLDAFRRADVPGAAREGSRVGSNPAPDALLAGRVVQAVGDGPSDDPAEDQPADAPDPSSASERPDPDPAGAGLVRDGIYVSATRELAWDTNRGVVLINTPRAQGVCGFLAEAGPQRTGDLVFDIRNRYAAAVMVSLDGEPLARSKRALLQIVTRDRNAGWDASSASPRLIRSTGTPPIMVRQIRAGVASRHARPFTLTPLGADRTPMGPALSSDTPDGVVELLPGATWYLVTWE